MSIVVNPRLQAYKSLEQSMLASNIDISERQRLTDKLLECIKGHRLFSHPVFTLLSEGKFSKSELREVHLDYRLLVKQFTDTILMAQFKTRELDVLLNDNGFMSARFLITLNILDEVGFYPGDKQYLGNPKFSHFILFDEVLRELGVTSSEIKNFKYSKGATDLHAYIESSFDDLGALMVYLIVTEEGAMHYSTAMRKAAHLEGLDVSQGYYNVHGDTSESITEGEDDLHQDDVINILQLLINEDNFEHFVKLTNDVCTHWAQFWDEQASRCVLNELQIGRIQSAENLNDQKATI